MTTPSVRAKQEPGRKKAYGGKVTPFLRKLPGTCKLQSLTIFHTSVNQIQASPCKPCRVIVISRPRMGGVRVRVPAVSLQAFFAGRAPSEVVQECCELANTFLNELKPIKNLNRYTVSITVPSWARFPSIPTRATVS